MAKALDEDRLMGLSRSFCVFVPFFITFLPALLSQYVRLVEVLPVWDYRRDARPRVYIEKIRII